MSSHQPIKDNRKILHVDLDAFFASVEELDQPELALVPMAVGGQSKRGIITTCNYKARAYGIHSAMPVFQAKQNCPDLKIVPMRRERYVEKSNEVFAVLRSYTRKLEQMSIDEAYLDISSRPEDALFIAQSLQDEVTEKTGLSISVGVSFNKFLAKLASDWKKPHGIFQITEDDIPDLLLPLPVGKIHGIGRAAERKLNSLSLYTILDLHALEESTLNTLLGKNGSDVYRFIRGIDHRPVTVNRERKSIGVERTFDHDIRSRKELTDKLDHFCNELAKDLKDKKIAAKTIHIKLKTNKFETISRSHSTDVHIQEAEDIQYIARFLFEELPLAEPIRLLGVSGSNLIEEDIHQINFFELPET